MLKIYKLSAEKMREIEDTNINVSNNLFVYTFPYQKVRGHFPLCLSLNK